MSPVRDEWDLNPRFPVPQTGGYTRLAYRPEATNNNIIYYFSTFVNLLDKMVFLVYNMGTMKAKENSAADYLSKNPDEYNALMYELQHCKGMAVAVCRLRLHIIDFLEWKRNRIIRRPWLLFKSYDYWWKNQFAKFVEGKIEREISDRLFDTIRGGRTQLLALAHELAQSGHDIGMWA